MATQQTPQTESHSLASHDQSSGRKLGYPSRGDFVTTIRATGFWAAIVLPFLHIPLLLNGLGTSGELIAFIALIVANIVAIRLGYNHRRTAQ